MQFGLSPSEWRDENVSGTALAAGSSVREIEASPAFPEPAASADGSQDEEPAARAAGSGLGWDRLQRVMVFRAG
ncbi:MAG: hypothetical protein SGI77_28035 [Pirellulaceae bacterium]|nr:hypothetical protein [Pirellulaceae bacterium]